MTKTGRGGIGTTLILALLLVVVSLAAGVGLALVIWNPTDPGEGDALLGIRQLNELTTVEYTAQVLVTVEEDAEIGPVTIPEFLKGEKLLLVAVGEVEAGVDLDMLGPEDVRVVGKTVMIDLPEARILGSSLDEDRTRLYDRDRGLLTSGNDELIEEGRRKAEDRVVEIAQENDILDKAQENAEVSIRTLMTSSGYERVVFE